MNKCPRCHFTLGLNNHHPEHLCAYCQKELGLDGIKDWIARGRPQDKKFRKAGNSAKVRKIFKPHPTVQLVRPTQAEKAEAWLATVSTDELLAEVARRRKAAEEQLRKLSLPPMPPEQLELPLSHLP